MPSNATLDTTIPHAMILTLHIFGVFSLLCNLLGIYVVWKKSPQILSSYRYSLIYMQVTATVMDVYLTFFFCPVPLFPIVAGYSVGLLSTVFKITIHIQMVILLVLMCAMVVAIISSMFIKHQAVQAFKLSTTKFCAMLISLTVLYLGPIPVLFALSSITREHQERTVREEYPLAIGILDIPSVQVYSWDSKSLKAFFGFLLILVPLASVLIVGTAAHIFYLLEQQKAFMSAKTLHMHRQTTINLLVQVSVPMSAYAVPVFIVVLVLVLDISGTQTLCNACVCVFGAHSTVAAIVMILSRKQYRIGCMELLHCKRNTIEHSGQLNFMPSNATFDLSYPQTMMIFLHFFGVFSLIFNTLGLYVVHKKSPRILGSYKHCVIYIQVWSAITDVYLTFFMCPIPLFPIVAGYTLGLLGNVFKISAHIQMTIVLLLMSSLAASICSSMLMKHQAVQQYNTMFKLSGRALWAALFIINMKFIVPLTTLFALSSIPRDLQERTVREEYPLAIAILDLETVQVYSWDYNQFIVYFFGYISYMIVFTALFMIFVAFHIFYTLDNQKIYMSARTLKMHRQTTMNLLLQVCVPLLSYFVPVAIVVLVMIANIDGTQGLCNACVCVFSTHSVIATFVMIVSRKQYRDGIMEILFLKAKSNISEQSQMGLTRIAEDGTRTTVIQVSRLLQANKVSNITNKLEIQATSRK